MPAMRRSIVMPRLSTPTMPAAPAAPKATAAPNWGDTKAPEGAATPLPAPKATAAPNWGDTKTPDATPVQIAAVAAVAAAPTPTARPQVDGGASAPAQASPQDGGGDSTARDGAEDDAGPEADDDRGGDSDAGAEGAAVSPTDAAPLGPLTLAGMRASANVSKGRLCVLGLCDSQWGSVPITCHVAIEGGAALADGAIDLYTPLPPAVQAALAQCERKLAMAAKKETFLLAVENLVRRARLGDQNAMAMIAMVREQALKGIARAREAHLALLAYAQQNPQSGTITRDATMAGETLRLPPAALRASSSLANGPALTRAHILTIAKSLGPSQAKALLFGCANYRDIKKIADMGKAYPSAQGAFQGGAAIGFARAIQLVRLPGSSLVRFSPAVAWELGE